MTDIDRRKRGLYYVALWELFLYLLFLFGFYTMILWLFVYDLHQTIMYFGYCYGYTGVLLMQVRFTRHSPEQSFEMS